MNLTQFSQDESQFGFDELFFSRTDAKGIILSGNSVFQRVSEFTWDQLLKKPHNLIRHPDMPRGVFNLFWDTIKQGHPIAAYVKNRSRTGKYYWVYALALPIQDNYLSIRLKPSGALKDIVEGEYKKLRDLELGQKISPQASQETLLQDLKSLGFQNYTAFMVTALKQELEARQTKLNAAPIPILVHLESVLQAGNQIQKKSQEILSAYQASQLVPLNLEIKTARIGDEAAPLAVVASKYETMAREIQTEIYDFVKISESAQTQLEGAQFEICAALLQAEVLQFFKNEKDGGPIDVATELQFLTTLKTTGLDRALSSLKSVELEYLTFENKCADLKTTSTGLEIVRLTGKIEAAKIRDTFGELQSLIEELTGFRLKLAGALAEIETLVYTIKSQTHSLAEEMTSL